MMDSKENYRFHLKVKSSSMNESKCTQRLKARKPSRRPIDLIDDAEISEELSISRSHRNYFSLSILIYQPSVRAVLKNIGPILW